MARCPSCNKFVQFDTEQYETEQEVEVYGIVVQAEVRIMNCCAECGEELTQASFAFHEHLNEVFDGKFDECGDSETGFNEGHNLDATEDGIERTCRVEGKGRGAKTFYGVKLDYTVKCDCGLEASSSLVAEEQASSMETN